MSVCDASLFEISSKFSGLDISCCSYKIGSIVFLPVFLAEKSIEFMTGLSIGGNQLPSCLGYFLMKASGYKRTVRPKLDIDLTYFGGLMSKQGT